MKNILLLIISSIITINFTYSQSGPGGIRNSTSNLLWLNADSILQVDSSFVDEWRDLSGNNNDAIQNTVTSQPQLIYNAANSHKALFFDGNSDFMSLTNHITSDDISIYIVFSNIFPTPYNRYGITLQDHYMLTQKYGGGGAHEQSGFEYSGSFYWATQVQGKLEPISGHTIGSSTYIKTNKRGYVLHDNTRAPLNSNSQSLVGALYNGASTVGFHHGQIAEIIVYNDTLNTVEQKILMNVLTAKYGNNMLENDFYAYQNTHSNGLIGIGNDGASSHTHSKGQGVVEISNPSDLNANEFLLTGHDNGNLDTTHAVPTNFEARWNRVWRADKTGDLGNVTMKFHLGNNTFGDLSKHFILIDNDGDFTNGGTSQHDFGRSVDAVNGTVSFDAVFIPDGYYYTLALEDDVDIQTVTSGFWEDPNTWDCICVPQPYHNATINNTHTVTLRDNRQINSLFIDEFGIFNLNPVTIFTINEYLNVSGQMNNDQNLVQMQGENMDNLSSSEISFFNFEVLTSGVLTTTGSWSISNLLQVSSTSTLNNQDQIRFSSTSTKTGQIIETSGDINGDYLMERYISPRKAEYINLASPTPTTIADWDQEIYMSGVSGNDGNALFSPTGPVYYSVYSYDNISQTYDTITSVNTPVVPGLGYELFLGDDLFEYTPVELGTINVHGTPTTGNVTVNVNEGFNLLGNPYQAFIDWSLVDKPTGLSNQYYVFDSNTGNYSLYSSTTLIPPSQGFWVEKSIGSGGVASLTFMESDKSALRSGNTSTFLRSKFEGTDSLMITITNDLNPYSHVHVIEFNPMATVKEDAYDISYLPSRAKGVPAIYSSVKREYNGQKRNLMLNSIGTEKVSFSIPLKMKAGDDASYTLQFNNIEGINKYYSCIYLEDKLEGKMINLNNSSAVNFSAKKGEYDRFELHFKKGSGFCDIHSKNTSGFNVFSINKEYGDYFLNYEIGESNDHISIDITDALGRKVKTTYESSINGSGKIKIDTDNLNGIYLIQVESKSGRRYSDKFYF